MIICRKVRLQYISYIATLLRHNVTCAIDDSAIELQAVLEGTVGCTSEIELKCVINSEHCYITTK